jgi:type VII secretion effector (TIGR04197 family)
MSTNDFLKSENIDLLWEILIDDPFSYIPQDEMGKFRSYFMNETTLFYNTYSNSPEIKNNNLMSLNQIFLRKIIQQSKPPLKQMQPQPQQQMQPPLKQQQQLYKAEDIQTDRINKFELDLNKKRQEFENSITLQKPPVPTFEDKKSEHMPINDMEALIAQTLLQRNYDISNIQPLNNNNASWLQPTETSIKMENQTSNNNAIKYIKIGREQLPSLTTEIIDITQPEKKVSWNTDVLQSFNNLEPVNNLEPFNDLPSNNNNNIFSKLKIKHDPNNNDNGDSNINGNSNFHSQMQSLQEEFTNFKEELTNFNKQMTNLDEKMTNIETKFDITLQRINMLLDKAN